MVSHRDSTGDSIRNSTGSIGIQPGNPETMRRRVRRPEGRLGYGQPADEILPIQRVPAPGKIPFPGARLPFTERRRFIPIACAFVFACNRRFLKPSC